jgi:hypothetical protein
MKTKNGCTVVFERAGQGVGITVKQPDGKSMLLVCNVSDIPEIIAKLSQLNSVHPAG